MQRRLRRSFLLVLALTSFFFPRAQAAQAAFSATVSRPFFNPSTAETVVVNVAVPDSGKLTARVIDRDGYVVRLLVRDQLVHRGATALKWDGRDDLSRIVPDEAYSFKIDFVSGSHHETYFPANIPAPPVGIAVHSYDRYSGVLAYELPSASRVHIQAGTATTDGAGHAEGPVLKTIADQQPRTRGAVIEQWNGLDESGTISVSDLPHFAISILATPLPENAVITVGNRATNFLAYAATHHGASLLAPVTGHMHHSGLQAIDDVAPRLRLTLKDARWSESEKAWRTPNQNAVVRLALEGPASDRFAMHSKDIIVFLDEQRVVTAQSTTPATEIALTLPDTGIHTIAVNWVNGNGPVAVNALRCQRVDVQLTSR
jgi:hypothetical protein